MEMVIQECEHADPPSIADGTEQLIADIMWADAVERNIRSGGHLRDDGEGPTHAAGEPHPDDASLSEPSSSSKPTVSSGQTKVYPKQAALSGLMPIMQHCQLPSHGSISHGSTERCLICKANLPGGLGCQAGRTCHKCHAPHGLEEVSRGGGISRYRAQKRTMEQTRYPSSDPFR